MLELQWFKMIYSLVLVFLYATKLWAPFVAKMLGRKSKIFPLKCSKWNGNRKIIIYDIQKKRLKKGIKKYSVKQN